MPGIEQEHLFHLTVFIPVIIGETYLFGNSQTGLLHQFAHILVEPTCRGTPVLIRAIIGIVMQGLNRTDDIESQTELTVTLVIEIVADTARCLVVRIALEVDDVRPGMKRVFILEPGIRKLHEDDQSTFLTEESILLRCLSKTDT